MHYRSIGTSGIRVSEISVAGSTTGQMVRGSLDEQIRAVEHTIDLGINYFELPAGDSDQSPPADFGRIFRELRIRPILATNVAIDTRDVSDIAGQIQRTVDGALQRLGIEYLDVVNVVNGVAATKPDRRRRSDILGIEEFLRDDGVVDGITRLVRDGKTRLVGLAAHGNDAPEVRHLIDSGAFHLLNVAYNLTNPSAAIGLPGGAPEPDFGQIMRYAQQRGLGAMVHDPLAGVAPPDRAPDDHDAAQSSHADDCEQEPHPSEQDRRSGEPVANFRFLLGYADSLSRAAAQYVLMEPAVTSLLVEADDLWQLEEACAASGAGPLNEQAQIRIEMAWRGAQWHARTAH